MEVRVYDEEAEGHSISFDEFLEEMKKNDEKKNFRNWFNKHFPGFGSYNAYYNLCHPWEVIDECLRQVKWAWQRVFRGWDDRVIWSIDGHISKLLPIWLRELKIQRHGVPSMMFKEEDYIDENYNVTDETMKIRGKEYDEILEKIAKGLDIYHEDNWFTEDSDDYKIFSDSFDLLKKYFGTLWD